MPGQVPVFLIESAELLFQGSYARRGFDLEISGPDGTVVVIADYFSFDPPPSLMLADGSGNGFSPAMVKALLHDRFDGVLFAGPAEVPPALEQIGVVRFASGNVVRKNADTGEEGEPLQKGDPVFKGDEIIITGGGYVVATLDDGSRISQGPNSRATLDNFSFNENEQTGEFKAKVAFGGFNFKSGKIGTFAGASRDHTEISTPSAVISIRGSEVDVNVDPATGDTLVRHQDGVLTVSDPNGLGAVQLVTSDTTTAVISGGLPANVGPSTPTQDAIFESALPPSNVMDSVDTTPPETEQTETSDGDKAPGPTEAPPEDAGETAEATGEAAEGEAEGEETTEEETDDETEDEADDSGEDSEDAADEESAEDTETAEDDTPTEEAEGSETETSEADGSEAESSEASSNAEGSAEGEAASDGSAGDGAESPGESAVEGSSSDADTAAEGSASDGGSSEGASGSGDAGGSESGTQGSTDSAVEPATSSGSTGTADAPLDLSPSGSDGSFSGSGATDSNTGSQTGMGSSDTGASGQPAVGTEPPAAPETQPELPPDTPPTSEDDAVTLAEGETLEISAEVLSNDEDPDQNQEPELASVNTTGTTGSVTLDVANQQLSYSADAAEFESLAEGETATDTFEYTISSGIFTSTSTVTVTIEGKDDPANAVDDAYATDGGVDLIVDAANGLLANDTDPDASDTLTVIAAKVVSDDATEITFEADGSFAFLASGSDALNQLAAGEVFSSTIEYTVQSSSGGTVTGVNDAPEVIEQTPELTPSVDATSGPTDITSQVLAVIGDDSPGTEVTAVDNTNTFGLVELGSVIYSANNAFVFLNAGENFTDEFGFTVTDIQGLNTDGVFLIDIEGVADAPVASGPVTFNQTEDDGVVVLDLLTNASDPDTTEVLSVAQTAKLTITGVNDDPTVAPVALNFTQTDAVATNQSFLQGATDIDTGDSLSLTGLTLTGGLDNGVTLATDTFDIDPQVYSFLGAGETEVITYTFNVLDVSGASTPGTVSITVTGINDVPTTTNASVTATEDQPFTLGSASFSFADVDTTDTLQQVRIDSLPALGSLKLGGAAVSVGQTINIADITDGLLTYNSVLNGNGLAYASFDFSVGDGTAFSASSTITIDVTPVNDAPVVAPITATLAQSAGVTLQSLLDGASDAEGDTLTISNFILSGGLGSGIARVGTDLSIDPLFYNTLGGTESEVITYTFDVIDGNGGVTPNTATITINGENDLPSTGNNTLATPEDTPVSINSIEIPFTDPDSLDLFEGIRIDSLPPGALGVLKLSGVNVTVGQVISVVDMDNGLFTYLPNTNINDGDGIASFTFSAFDGDGFSIAPGTLTINVNPVNDPPVAVADNYTVAFNGSLSATAGTNGLLDNDFDPEGETFTLNVTPVTGPTLGTISSGFLNGDGSFTYNPNFNFVGIDTFTYEVIDSNGASSIGTVTIDIVGGPGAVANSSGDFSDGSIFTSGTVPVATDDLFIDIGVSVDITELSPSPVTLLAVDIDGSGGFLGVTNNTLNVTNFITMGASSGLGVTDGVLTTGMSFTSDGFFTIENSDLTINTGVFSNSGTLEVTGNSSLAAPTSDNSSSLSLLGVPIYGSTQFTVSDGLDNLGTIDFKNDDTSARNISLNSAGTLSNQGTINILTGMGAGSRIIDVATFNNQGGLLYVDIGEVLDINADTTQVASDSQFNGSGAVRFNGTQTLSINDTSFGFVDTGGPTIEIGGAVTVSELGPPATFTIGTGATINILSAQSLTLNVDTVVNDGTIDLKGSLAATTLDVTNVTTFTNNGSIIGTGTIVDPSMVISGPGTVSVAPGSSPGILTFDGGLNTAIELETELEGLTPGSGHDQLQVIGDANIYSSQMDVILLNGFMPEIGDSFVVFTANSLTGHFGVVTGLDIASDRVLDIIYDGDDVVLIAVATTEIGTEAADTLVGSSEQDVVVAGGGDDQIISGIGSDMVFSQAGNDTIEVASDFSRVDGGAGIDRLIVTQFNEDDGSRVDNVEVLDIGDGDAALSATTISEVVSGTNDITGLADSLVLDGDSGSTVTLVGEFAYDRSEQLDSGNGLSDYDVYIDNGASIFVLQGVLVAHQAVMESGSVAAPLDLSGVDSLVAKQETDHTLAPTSEVALTDIFGEQDPLSELLAALPGESSAGSTFAAPVGGVAIAGGTSISALHGELLPLDYHHSEV
jgi:hypothetical protein